MRKPFSTAQRAGGSALSQMRHQKPAERIGTLVRLKLVGRGDHARGPGVEGVITGERLGDLLRPVDRQRLRRLGWLTWPNHTRARHKKSRERVPLRADVDFDTVNFGSDSGKTGNVKSTYGAGLTRTRECDDRTIFQGLEKLTPQRCQHDAGALLRFYFGSFLLVHSPGVPTIGRVQIFQVPAPGRFEKRDILLIGDL